ncbi:hypothetical protein ACFQV2_12170 [Actinokineospora soli]|uniref:Uncharacterized protein n=1 Tax=Actinokineospora soli TaxID=1048753 RepID=A0ABW2TLR1_9PSEU
MVYAFDPFVDEDAPHGEFGIAVHPLSLHVARLGEGSALVRTWAGTAPRPLSLTVSGLPAAVEAACDPISVSAGADAQLTLRVGEVDIPRTHAIVVTATCPEGRIARAYLSLTIR